MKQHTNKAQIQTQESSVAIFIGQCSYCHFISSLMVLLLCSAMLLFSAKSIASTQLPSVKHSYVWQVMIKEIPKEKGIFNRALRESVREVLPLIELSSIDTVDAEVFQQKLSPRLKKLDQSLQKYIRVSESLNRYQQLEKLMPALFAIEEYKLIKQLYKQQNIRLPNLRNGRLLSFLDRRLTQLASYMIFNMKALVRERRPYESHLLKAMASYGVEYSAKPPDFIMEYEINFENRAPKGEWVFNTSIGLLDSYHIPFVKLNEIIVVEAKDREMAQKKALEVMAKLITMELRFSLIKSHID